MQSPEHRGECTLDSAQPPGSPRQRLEVLFLLPRTRTAGNAGKARAIVRGGTKLVLTGGDNLEICRTGSPPPPRTPAVFPRGFPYLRLQRFTLRPVFRQVATDCMASQPCGANRHASCEALDNAETQPLETASGVQHWREGGILPAVGRFGVPLRARDIVRRESRGRIPQQSRASREDSRGAPTPALPTPAINPPIEPRCIYVSTGKGTALLRWFTPQEGEAGVSVAVAATVMTPSNETHGARGDLARTQAPYTSAKIHPFPLRYCCSWHSVIWGLRFKPLAPATFPLVPKLSRPIIPTRSFTIRTRGSRRREF